MRNRATVYFLASTILAVACATTTMAPDAQDAAGKRFVAPPGKARVYVTRPGTQGAAGLANVMIDGRLIGQLAIQTYVYADLEPGEHSIAWSGVHPFTVGEREIVFFASEISGFSAETLTQMAARPFSQADSYRRHPE